MKSRIDAWLRLMSIRSVGTGYALRLVEKLGEPETFVGLGLEPLQDIDFLNDDVKMEIANCSRCPENDRVFDLMGKHDIRFVSILDDDYPTLLKAIYYPPAFLFYRGELRKDWLRRTIAVVGTRKPSSYGREQAARIVRELARAGFTIVSGLAYGIDAIAHKAAIDEGLPTIAAMGTGCETIYPDGHRELADAIMANGCILSEYLPGSEATKGNFPRRNRIISGLSLGTFVVEGNRRSGALITSKYATDQNRSVFALPGDVNREQAEGPNYLIRLGARIVTRASDILEEFNILQSDSEQAVVFPELNPPEETVYNLLVENRPEMDFDNLYIKAGMSISELSGVLLGLDIKGVIRRLPGNHIAPAY
jgi:DNA processing protein